jgi:hypothetical protein
MLLLFQTYPLSLFFSRCLQDMPLLFLDGSLSPIDVFVVSKLLALRKAC